MVENCDTMLEILHKHKPFERITDPENCDVRVCFCEGFSPGHVIITTIIMIIPHNDVMCTCGRMKFHILDVVAFVAS